MQELRPQPSRSPTNTLGSNWACISLWADFTRCKPCAVRAPMTLFWRFWWAAHPWFTDHVQNCAAIDCNLPQVFVYPASSVILAVANHNFPYQKGRFGDLVPFSDTPRNYWLQAKSIDSHNTPTIFIPILVLFGWFVSEFLLINPEDFQDFQDVVRSFPTKCHYSTSPLNLDRRYFNATEILMELHLPRWDSWTGQAAIFAWWNYCMVLSYRNSTLMQLLISYISFHHHDITNKLEFKKQKKWSADTRAHMTSWPSQTP